MIWADLSSLSYSITTSCTYPSAKQVHPELVELTNNYHCHCVVVVEKMDQDSIDLSNFSMFGFLSLKNPLDSLINQFWSLNSWLYRLGAFLLDIERVIGLPHGLNTPYFDGHFAFGYGVSCGCKCLGVNN